jgi:hypothetical protein
MPLEPSFYEARPSLGTSVDAVLRGWRGAAQASTAPAQRVRALLTTGQVGEWEFSWQEGVIHRILSAGGSRSATTGELEMLRKCMVHGWFFVYLTEEGQEPVVLHTVGIVTQDSSESPLLSPSATLECEGKPAQASRMPGGEIPRQEEPSLIRPESVRNSAGKRPVSRRLALLLLGGAVGGLCVIGWLVTHRSEPGMVLTVLALLVLGRKIRQAEHPAGSFPKTERIE